MTVIAYIRKSTDKQSFEHQEFEIKEYAKKNNLKIDRWIEESISSRKELKKRKLCWFDSLPLLMNDTMLKTALKKALYSECSR